MQSSRVILAMLVMARCPYRATRAGSYTGTCIHCTRRGALLMTSLIPRAGFVGNFIDLLCSSWPDNFVTRLRHRSVQRAFRQSCLGCGSRRFVSNRLFRHWCNGNWCNNGLRYLERGSLTSATLLLSLNLSRLTRRQFSLVTRIYFTCGQLHFAHCFNNGRGYNWCDLLNRSNHLNRCNHFYGSNFYYRYNYLDWCNHLNMRNFLNSRWRWL